MATKASFQLQGRNPDVLTCIANLSNDAVFTPPEIANQMLDSLEAAWAESNGGASIWEDSKVTFLDPFTKTGVFLREIVSRLNKGLEEVIPDLQERVDHILTKQVFGIATETLTSLLARRSVYCSKYANGNHSITKSFETEQGNIWFERTDHTWVGGRNKILVTNEEGKTVKKSTNGKCKFCGASQTEYERDTSLESHAYAFIHQENIKEFIAEIFGADMKFDVVIGNPPYQLGDGGAGSSASPIYQYFITQAKKLEPQMICMIIPSKWFSGGKGLDDFRATMLKDKHIKKLVDYFDTKEVFPSSADVSGGVCYFLRDTSYKGDCEIVSIRAGKTSKAQRPLLLQNSDTFVRFNEAISILEKIQRYSYTSFSNHVSSRRPFDIDTNAKLEANENKNYVKVYAYPKVGYLPREKITRNKEWINEYKVLTAKAYGERGPFPYLVTGKPFIGEPGTCCTETYLVAFTSDSKEQAKRVMQYMSTKFFRFLVLLKKNTQNAAKGVYEFVPDLDYSVNWDDSALFSHFGLTDIEIQFIESLVRPMELNHAS